jgi:hypothetical protein
LSSGDAPKLEEPVRRTEANSTGGIQVRIIVPSKTQSGASELQVKNGIPE